MLFSLPAFLAILVWLTAFVAVLAIKRTPAALAGGMMLGMLFLPQLKIDTPFLALDKSVLLAFVTAIGVLLIDPSHLPQFRLSVLDLPVILLCFSGLAAGLSNGLGPYNAAATATQLIFTWGIPFFIGRIVFASQQNALILLRTVIWGAVLYVPFCLFEMKMSPVLHPMIYGYTPRGGNDHIHAIRFGLWRPTVFMEMGLQLSLFMGISSVVALWGAMSAQIPKVMGISTYLISSVLGIVTVFCVSSGAILITAVGWCVVLSSRLKLQRYLLLALLLWAVSYPVYRMTNVGAIQIEITEEDEKDPDIAARKHSLKTRIDSEDMFIKKWSGRPIFGWTRWFFMRTEDGYAIPDSLWIIILACYGLVGWIGWTLMLAAPASISIRNAARSAGFLHPVTAMAICVVMFWLDALMNAFPTVLYGVIAGTGASCWSKSTAVAETEAGSQAQVNFRPQRVLWPPR